MDHGVLLSYRLRASEQGGLYLPDAVARQLMEPFVSEEAGLCIYSRALPVPC